MNAREAAYRAISAVLKEGAYTSLALKKAVPASFSAEDRHFTSLLVRTTLENLMRIDFALSNFISSPRVHGSVKNILRLGACQLLFLDTDAYAAVNESVALAKRVKPQTAGFVNAVLRALEKGRDGLNYPEVTDLGALSVMASYPEWICEKYVDDFGWAFAKDLLLYRPQADTSVRMNALRTDAGAFEAELAAAGLDVRKGVVQDAYTVGGLADIEHMDVFRSGRMAVQSQSAMRAVRALNVKQGDSLLDCCAAPGGKSAYAAALTRNGIAITAWDIHEHRVDMTRRNFERLGVKNAAVFLRDAREFDASLERSFDVVLIDAPCSAMGLMAHQPDIRYARGPADTAALSAVQKQMLAVCARYVKPGGTLAYMTCSINREENEHVTDDFLSVTGGFGYDGAPVTLYPHLNGSDGFYYAVMRRL